MTDERAKNIEYRISQLEGDSRQTLQIVTEIKMGVLGSKDLEIEGVVQKVSRHEKYIENDKRQKWMIAGGIAVISTVFGLLIAFKDKIFNNG